MKVCFYCSYNLSPVGYQEITLDLKTGIQERTPMGVETVKNLLTHGGAKSAFGFDGSVYYLALKNMRETNQDIPLNTPGRNWYMNCAWAASGEELEDLCAVACYGYTDYQEFVSRLCACLSPQQEESSYVIDAEGMRVLMEEASNRYQVFLESGTAEFSSAPCGLGLEQMESALSILRTRDIKGLYEFVLLEGEVDYFLSSYNCQDPSQLRHYIRAGGEPSGEFRHTVRESVPNEKSNITPWVLLGGAAVFGITCWIVKGRKRAGRKRRNRYC